MEMILEVALVGLLVIVAVPLILLLLPVVLTLTCLFLGLFGVIGWAWVIAAFIIGNFTLGIILLVIWLFSILALARGWIRIYIGE